MDTMTLTLNHASVPAVLYGSPVPSGLALPPRQGRPQGGGRVLRPGGLPQGLAGTGHRPARPRGHGPAGRSSSPPWHAVPELRDLLSLSGQKWNRLALRAVSLGGVVLPAGLSGPPPGPSPLRLPRCWTWSA